MDKVFFKECIKEEVFGEFTKKNKQITYYSKIWCKYLNPNSNAVYLIRKKQYMASRGRIGRLLAIILRIKLIRRYGCIVGDNAEIGLGLRIVHPVGVIIVDCKIGENFTIYQYCTVGSKRPNSCEKPSIGNNVTMYAGSSAIGNVSIADGVVLGANATLLEDANVCGGIYCGVPAKIKITK